MKADHERELDAIHRDTAKHEREAVTEVNHQLLTQIKVLREVHQRVIELDAREILVDSSPEVNQQPAASADLCFKLNKMRSKVTVSHEDPESLQADSLRKRARGHRSLIPKEDALPTIAKTEDSTAFTPEPSDRPNLPHH